MIFPRLFSTLGRFGERFSLMFACQKSNFILVLCFVTLLPLRTPVIKWIWCGTIVFSGGTAITGDAGRGFLGFSSSADYLFALQVKTFKQVIWEKRHRFCIEIIFQTKIMTVFQINWNNCCNCNYCFWFYWQRSHILWTFSLSGL